MHHTGRAVWCALSLGMHLTHLVVEHGWQYRRQQQWEDREDQELRRDAHRSQRCPNQGPGPACPSVSYKYGDSVVTTVGIQGHSSPYYLSYNDASMPNTVYDSNTIIGSVSSSTSMPLRRGSLWPKTPIPSFAPLLFVNGSIRRRNCILALGTFSKGRTAMSSPRVSLPINVETVSNYRTLTTRPQVVRMTIARRARAALLSLFLRTEGFEMKSVCCGPGFPNCGDFTAKTTVAGLPRYLLARMPHKRFAESPRLLGTRQRCCGAGARSAYDNTPPYQLPVSGNTPRV